MIGASLIRESKKRITKGETKWAIKTLEFVSALKSAVLNVSENRYHVCAPVSNEPRATKKLGLIRLEG
jgi:hypothetical protein